MALSRTHTAEHEEYGRFRNSRECTLHMRVINDGKESTWRQRHAALLCLNYQSGVGGVAEVNVTAWLHGTSISLFRFVV